MALPRFRVTERQVLTLLLVASVLAVIAAILGSSFFTRSGKKLEPVTLAHIRWGRGDGGMRQVLADYFDPSLLSMPSPRGFSVGPWTHLAPPVASRYEPLIPPAFLVAPSVPEQPTLLPQAPLVEIVQAGLERVPVTMPEELPAMEVTPSATNSVIQLGGELTERRLVSSPVIPLAPTHVTVRRTLVLVAVGADGRVRHAVLDRSCGNEALDTEAVELIRNARFEPQASADALAVTWGRARFVWANAPGN